MFLDLENFVQKSGQGFVLLILLLLPILSILVFLSIDLGFTAQNSTFMILVLN